MTAEKLTSVDSQEPVRFQDPKVANAFWLLAISLILIAAKLWLVCGQTLFVIGGAGHDERLFLTIADHLINGNWLGPYNNLTLAKGIFYPVWIAAIYTLNLPLLLAQHLFYSAACLLFIFAIRPLVRHPAMLLLIFSVLLFNPISYSADIMARSLREGIYPALTLMTVAFSAGFLIRNKFSTVTLTLWSSGFGLSLSAFWLTREEGIWIMPTLAVFLVSAIVKIVQTKPVDYRKLLVCMLPFLIFGLSVGMIAGMNKCYYNVFTTNELKSSDFLLAYGALSRVQHADRRTTVPVPKETRERIYEVCPAFAELRPFLEGDIGKGWGGSKLFQTVRDHCKKNPEYARNVLSYLERNKDDIWVRAWNNGELFHNEIFGGWFLWALRDAVAAAGYYSSGDKAAQFYERLADEINTACNDGRLACGSKRSSLMPPWHREYVFPLLSTFWRSMIYFIRFEDFSAKSVPSLGTEDSFRLFYRLTRERLFPAKVRLQGWVFSTEGPVELAITGEDDNYKHVEVISNLPSEDVYQTFFSKGMNIPNARYARFDLKTYCIFGCTLHMRVGGHPEKNIPIDGTMPTLETPELYLKIDSVEYQNASLRQTKMDSQKTHILESIALPYQFAVPVLSCLGLIIYIIQTVLIFKKPILPMIWTINTGILLAVVIRLIVISMVNVTSFPAINTQYFSSSYPLLLIFSALNFVSLKREMRELRAIEL